MPRIALTMRVVETDGRQEPRDAISHEWLTWLADWGARPILIPNVIDDAGAYLDGSGADVLVLTGGDDLGHTPARDFTERTLLRRAMDRSLPTFGVCRGMQLVNTELGGELIRVTGHVATGHPVTVDGPLAEIYGPKADVNSFHAFGIAEAGLGDGLAPFARDDADAVEAFVHRSLPLAAVMWHPERPGAPDGDRTLLRRLVTEGAFWV